MFNKRFSERFVGVLGRDFIVSIISFVVTTYIAKSLGSEVFGLWIGVITLLSICDLLFRIKIDQLIVFYSKEYPFNSQLYKKITKLSVYGLLIGGLLVVSLSAVLVEFFSLNSGFFLALIFLSFCLSVFGNIIFYIFLSESKYSAYNFSILIQSLTTAIMVFALFNLFEGSIYLALSAHAVSWISVLLFFTIHRAAGNRNTAVQSMYLTDKDILLKGRYIYASSAVRSMVDQIPRLFAINFLGSAFVGNLGLTQLILGLINRVPAAINTVLYPMLVKESGDELTRSVGIIRALLLIFLPIILFLEMFVPYLISTFYGDTFSSASFYIQICLPFVYFGLPGLILTAYFSSTGEFSILFITNLIAVMASLTSLYAMSFLSVQYAPIVAICLSFFCLTISSIFFASKNMPVSEFFPGLVDLRKLLRFMRSFVGGQHV